LEKTISTHGLGIFERTVTVTRVKVIDWGSDGAGGVAIPVSGASAASGARGSPAAKINDSAGAAAAAEQGTIAVTR